MNLLTKPQQIIFDEVSKDKYLRSNFYLTGGTALSAFYLNHRESEDLDFFSEKPYNNLFVLERVTKWAQKYKAKLEQRSVEDLQIFNLTFRKDNKTKVDFSSYPYIRIKKGKKVQGIDIDSKIDIAINKLLTINQRTEVKDFVDLYFLLKKFSLWDLVDGVKIKFGLKLEPVMIGSNFLKVDGFEVLPEMRMPLQLQELQDFFKDQAKKIGMSVVEK